MSNLMLLVTNFGEFDSYLGFITNLGGFYLTDFDAFVTHFPDLVTYRVYIIIYYEGMSDPF